MVCVKCVSLCLANCIVSLVESSTIAELCLDVDLILLPFRLQACLGTCVVSPPSPPVPQGIQQPPMPQCQQRLPVFSTTGFCRILPNLATASSCWFINLFAIDQYGRNIAFLSKIRKENVSCCWPRSCEVLRPCPSARPRLSGAPWPPSLGFPTLHIHLGQSLLWSKMSGEKKTQSFRN